MDTSQQPTALSIGILAWNEEDTIATALETLFHQSVFTTLANRGQRSEVVVVANGCTDRTVEVARATFERIAACHPAAAAVNGRVVDVREPGKCNAWNRFVHEFSAREAPYLCFMDADIVFQNADAILLLLHALDRDAHARAASGRPCKDIQFKARKTWRDRVSLATSNMAATGTGQICGQFYCLRADVARGIYLPRDLNGEDGFIKAAICTDGFTRASDPSRIATVPEAVHVFEAYMTPRQILNNQTRQMVLQTHVHVLVEFARKLSTAERGRWAELFRRLDHEEPDWLERQLAEHLRRERHFWRLFPNLLSFRFRRLAQLPWRKKITHFPAACIGFSVTLITSARAHRAFRSGLVRYWPKAARSGSIPPSPASGASRASDVAVGVR